MSDQEWIRLQDQSPDNGQKVIAYALDGKDQIKDLMQECHFLSGMFFYGFHSNRMSGVTHWMPFPEHPDLAECERCESMDEIGFNGLCPTCSDDMGVK